MWHYKFLRAKLKESNMKHKVKLPVFHDVEAQLSEVVTGMWVKSSLPVLSKSKIEIRYIKLLEKWKMTEESKKDQR